MQYLESSALAKLYVAETGSSAVQTAVLADPEIVTSLMTALELRAALAAAGRAGRVLDLASAVSEFRLLWPGVVALDVTVGRIEEGAILAERHALRAGDALQLASALFAAAGDPSRLPFGSFDERLNRAAVAEGFPVLF